MLSSGELPVPWMYSLPTLESFQHRGQHPCCPFYMLGSHLVLLAPVFWTCYPGEEWGAVCKGKAGYSVVFANLGPWLALPHHRGENLSPELVPLHLSVQDLSDSEWGEECQEHTRALLFQASLHLSFAFPSSHLAIYLTFQS